MKIGKIPRILENLKPIVFDEKALHSLQKKVSLKSGLIALAVMAFVLVFPMDWASFNALPQNFLTVLPLLAGMMCASYLVARLVEPEGPGFLKFFSTVTLTLTMSYAIISLPIFIFCHLVFSTLLSTPVVSLVFFSLIPYYNFVLFGWACENSSGAGGVKSILVALAAMTMMFLLHFSLIFITV